MLYQFRKNTYALPYKALLMIGGERFFDLTDAKRRRKRKRIFSHEKKSNLPTEEFPARRHEKE
jgi:hypothetical protein